MIVPVDSERYSNLFADAELFLGLEEGTIGNLNAYYGYMKDFYNRAVSDPQHNYGYKFIMMPLDEEVFNINLNTRSISIPATFAKTGGVQADQMAELIIFETDRYFDYMDLANTQIYVQWQLPDNNHTAGATAITIKDLNSKPGKIRFAWPLHDTITKYQGVIKFSVRFYLITEERNQDGTIQRKLSYSLNTLDANLTIKPALNPTADILPESVGGLFEKSIINSQYTNEGQPPPVEPDFESPGLDMYIDERDTHFVRYLSDEESNGFKTQVAKLHNNKLVLKAQAVASGAGKIVYDWKFAKDGDRFEDGTLKWTSLSTEGNIESEPAIFLINPISGKEYLSFRDAYYDAEGNRYSYTDTAIPDIDLYEKYTVYSLPEEGDVVGYYAVGAKNVSGNAEAGGLISDERWSSRCYLPGPADIKFASKIFTEEIIEGKKNIKVNILEDINDPTVEETWYYSSLDPANVVNTAETGNVAANVSLADMDTLVPGWYTARIKANLNRKDKFAGTPEPHTIYAEAKITSAEPPEGVDRSLNLASGETADLALDVVVPIPEGFVEGGISDALYKNLQYDWQYSRIDINVWKSIPSTMISATDPSKPIVFINHENGTMTVRKPAEGGVYQYRCIVSNVLGKDNIETKTQENLYTVL